MEKVCWMLMIPVSKNEKERKELFAGFSGCVSSKWSFLFYIIFVYRYISHTIFEDGWKHFRQRQEVKEESGDGKQNKWFTSYLYIL